jgi:hypothetical protein
MRLAQEARNAGRPRCGGGLEDLQRYLVTERLVPRAVDARQTTATQQTHNHVAGELRPLFQRAAATQLTSRLALAVPRVLWILVFWMLPRHVILSADWLHDEKIAAPAP